MHVTSQRSPLHSVHLRLLGVGVLRSKYVLADQDGEQQASTAYRHSMRRDDGEGAPGTLPPSQVCRRLLAANVDVSGVLRLVEKLHLDRCWRPCLVAAVDGDDYAEGAVDVACVLPPPVDCDDD